MNRMNLMMRHSPLFFFFLEKIILIYRLYNIVEFNYIYYSQYKLWYRK